MRLDVHIGLHKTASTSFQEFLYINKNELSNVGVLYPDEDINKSLFEYIQVMGEFELLGEMTALTMKLERQNKQAHA